jgi:enoyl-CoA hydratase
VNPSPSLVRTDVDDHGVAVLVLDDPQRRNALSRAMSDDLAAAVEAVLAANAGAIVLTAAPPVFCAGGSLEDLERPDLDLRAAYAGFLALASAPVPTIAVVAGGAFGAGVNLPLACDVVLATPEARFDPRFLDLGIHPGGGHLWRLRERVGRQGAAALVLGGDALTGEEAVVVGLAWRCLPTSDDAVAYAHRLATRAATRDRALVARTKTTLDALAAVTSSADAVEVEHAAQQWSIEQPAFREALARLRARLKG